MTWPRFTLRALMIGVAIAAVASWAQSLRRRSAEFSANADRHWANLIELSGSKGRSITARRRILVHAVGGPENAKREIGMRWLDYEERMYFKYRRAARLPWLPIGPDPPPPAGQW
jgi:hypothetical protein